MQGSTRIAGATVLTMVPGAAPAVADVRLEGNRISHVGAAVPPADRTVEADGAVLLPGFVQTHVHLCQTLFRNLADDLTLLDWLALRIWPLEAALGPAEMRASADLGLAELIRGGTTTILDMGSVHHTDAIGEAVRDAGSRAFLGKAMMDAGLGVPAGLHEATRDSLAESEALAARWDGQADGRIGYAYAPRFAPSCSRELLQEVAERCRQQGLLIHTHCAESRGEVELVRRTFDMGNLEFLDACGLTGKRSVFAHMVHLDGHDLEVVRQTGTRVAHCPSSNLKLASGIAPIVRYLELGIHVSLGADGAPCNNTLDAFMEMRLAALIQRPQFGPAAISAETVLRMATLGGAEALGIDDRVGTIEAGKRADLTLLRLDRAHNGVTGDMWGNIVFTASRENVSDVWCDGRQLVAGRELVGLDEARIVAQAREAAQRVQSRL